MRIAIDAQPLLEQSAGVTYYSKGLVEAVLKQDRNNHYDLLFWRLFPKKPLPVLGEGRNFSYRWQRFFPYKIFYKLFKWGIRIPLELFFLIRPDLYFFPNFVVYPHRRGKSVVLIHDLTFEKVPQYVARRNVEFLRKFVPPSVARADHVVVNCEFTKRELIEAYRVPAEKVTVAYPGVDPKSFYPRSAKDKEEIKRKYGINKPFLLFLGTLEPRKNVPAILKVYADLPNRRDFNLVLAGKRGWLSEEIFRTVADLGLEEDVIFTGYVPEEDRPKLMSAAEVFVFPSFFEGFGMPVVEAQACGTPVVTSNTTSLPEAAGKGAVLVDPKNVYQLARAIEEVLSSGSLREKLVKKGLANARRFDWNESARKLIEIFNRLG
ncbi:MAG TPA: glycosyltransferase family 1 protein [Patescibacteria group bacterium]|nr:glycosyltransferase family 1 protein [Patescibacteria group bacterium]